MRARALLVAAAIAWTPATVAASPDLAAPAPDGGDVARARALFAEGLAHARAGDHARARASFLAAHGRVPSVDILWNLAITEQKLGDDVSALRRFREYAAHPQARADRREEIAKGIGPALERTTATLSVDVPPKTTIAVDGEVQRSRDVVLAPGLHAVVATNGDRERRFAVDLAAGESRLVSVDMDDARAPRPPPKEAVAPPPAIPPPRPIPPPAPAASGPRWAPLALGAGALVLVGGGVYVTTRATAAGDERERLWGEMQVRHSPCGKTDALCASYADARDDARRLEAVAIGMFATAGALGGAAVITWLVGSKTSVAPAVGRGELGLTIAGAL